MDQELAAFNLRFAHNSHCDYADLARRAATMKFSVAAEIVFL